VKLKPGDKVWHKTHGIGTIIEQWGSWFSCRDCYAEVNNIQGCKHILRVNKTKRLKYDDMRVRVSITPNIDCYDPEQIPGVYLISGSGIFNIAFPHGTEAINQRWLILPEDKHAESTNLSTARVCKEQPI
jgi:hypothetical protein